MNPTDLPLRLRESSFRLYEDVIARAIACYPGELHITDIKCSPITYSARLRDAMLSLFRYRWQTKVDLGRFLLLFNEKTEHRKIQVVHSEDGGIVIKPKNQPFYSPTVVSLSEHNVPESSLAKIESFCADASDGQVSRPMRATLTEAQAADLERRFDVRVDRQADGSYTII